MIRMLVRALHSESILKKMQERRYGICSNGVTVYAVTALLYIQERRYCNFQKIILRKIHFEKYKNSRLCKTIAKRHRKLS